MSEKKKKKQEISTKSDIKKRDATKLKRSSSSVFGSKASTATSSSDDDYSYYDDDDDDDEDNTASSSQQQRRTKKGALRAFSSISSRQLRGGGDGSHGSSSSSSKGSPLVAPSSPSSSKFARTTSYRRHNQLSASSANLSVYSSSSTATSSSLSSSPASTATASNASAGKSSNKLKRLSASFVLRKGRIAGGSARSGWPRDEEGDFSGDSDFESADADGGGGGAGAGGGSTISSEAMLAKYLPFLATPAVISIPSSSSSSSAAAASSSSSSSSRSPVSDSNARAPTTETAPTLSVADPQHGGENKAQTPQLVTAADRVRRKTARSLSVSAYTKEEEAQQDIESAEGAPVAATAAAGGGGGSGVSGVTASSERQDAILSLIESESLGPTFRSVFEQEKEKEFVRTLGLFIRGKRKEIESVCNFHYQEFIHSVDELLALRTDIAQMKEDIVQLNSQIQVTGASLLDKTQGLIDLRATHANINAAIEELSRCMFLFHQCEEANRQIKDGQFYKALKVLDDIEHQSLPQLPQYEFAKYLESKIPALKETIKKYVTDEFNEWLVSMREHALDIGALAMEQMAAQIKEELRVKQELQEAVLRVRDDDEHEEDKAKTADKKKRRKNGNGFEKNDAKEKESRSASPTATTTRQNPGEDQDMGIFQRVGVAFTPVYKCIHIYDSLASIGEFESYYQYTRQLQAHLVQQGPTGPAFLASRRAYESYFYQIVGFFVVEAHVWHTTQNLIPHSTVKGWWDTAAHRIRGLLQEQVNTYCRDVVVLQQLRDFIFLFSRTISSYGYDVTVLQDFFKAMRDKYIDLATQSYRDEFFTVMERESFQPLCIDNEEEYHLMIVDNNLDQIYPHQKRLPMKFPFCAFIPNCVAIVRHFIKTYYEFSKDLFADTDEFVKKGTELLLKVMCSTISKQVTESSNSNVMSLVQLSLSLPFMRSCCNIFESYISSFKYLGAESSSLNRSMFDTLRDNAEKRMFAIIDMKIDSLFDNININWTPTSASKEPRDWVTELFLYLQTTLTVFDPLRQELKDEIALEAYNRTAINLRNMVYNNEARRINTAAIQSLDVDLRFAENYIRQWNIPSLQNSLHELRQLVNLLLSDNMLEFLDERIRRAKYPDLSDVAKIVSLLQKFETETTLGRFSVALGGKASKRQNVETLIRSLSSESRSGSSSPIAFATNLSARLGDKLSSPL